MSDVVYLAGQMSGLPQFNIPEFFRVAMLLREIGYNVINPAELDDSSGLLVASLQNLTGDPKKTVGFGSGDVWAEVLGRDVFQVLRVKTDGIVLLPTWHQSRGARIEAAAAYIGGKKMMLWNEELGHPIMATQEEIIEGIRG